MLQLSPPPKHPVPAYHYLYLLRSQGHPGRHYTGTTTNLTRRLLAHNAGQSRHAARYRPWLVETAIEFRSPEKALAFERYLKTGSGRAFAAKRF